MNALDAHPPALAWQRLYRSGAVSPVDAVPPPEDRLACLIGAVAAQDRQAFAALFKHFAPRVKNYLQRGGLAAPLAEELAQEVMINIWRKAEQFDPARASAATWVFAIARNIRISHARRHPALALLPEEEDASPTAESQLMAGERAAHMRAALAALPAAQLEILQMSFFAEKPHAAIAKALGLPLGTVKSRVRLALTKLRALLGEIE